jgi:hypothetical protein
LQGVATFKRIEEGLPYVATVALAVELDSTEFLVEFHCNGQGWTAQGHIEEVSEHGYHDWKAGAVAGVRFACDEAGIPNARVVVNFISGMITDTNPTVVAAAAALAVWKAFQFEPTSAAVELIEASVFRSWKSPEAIPDW